jgi:hypothetical protein
VQGTVATAEPPDPREDQEWFRRLPEHAREELRAGWRAKRAAEAESRARARRLTVRYIGEAAFVFALVTVVFQPFSIEGILRAAVFGALAGGAARALLAEALAYGAVALVAYAFHSGLATGLVGFADTVACVVLCTAAGQMHALQRADGRE